MTILEKITSIIIIIWSKSDKFDILLLIFSILGDIELFHLLIKCSYMHISFI